MKALILCKKSDFHNWLGVYNNNKQEMTLLGWLVFHFLIK